MIYSNVFVRGFREYYLRMETYYQERRYRLISVKLLIHTKLFALKRRTKYLVSLTCIQITFLAGVTRETVTKEIKKLEQLNPILPFFFLLDSVDMYSGLDS